MVKQFRSKTFKSGNSVALRLPKGLGIEEGREMTVREEQGHYIVEPVKPERKTIDFSFLDGKSLGLKPFTAREREIDHSPGFEKLMREVGWPKRKP